MIDTQASVSLAGWGCVSSCAGRRNPSAMNSWLMPELPPVIGACVLALQAAGVAVDAAIAQRLNAHKGQV